MIRKLTGFFVFMLAALQANPPKFPEIIDFGKLSLGANHFYDNPGTWTWELGKAAHEAGLSPFNDSPEIGAFFGYLKNTYHIETVIETGTYTAATTRFFAHCFKEVHTIEIVDRYYNDAKEVFCDQPNVHCHLGSSQKVLSEILPSLQGKPIVFYLDAHWDLYWPLFDELNEIGKTHKDNCIVIIDDFKVPGRNDIGYDGYEFEGVYNECCYDAIKDYLSNVFTDYSYHYLIPTVPTHRAKFVIIPKKLMKLAH